MANISTSTLFRLSGFALLVALPVQVAGLAMHPPGERVVDLLTPLQGPAHVSSSSPGSWCFWACPVSMRGKPIAPGCLA